MSLLPASQRVSRARARMLLAHKWFGSLSLMLKVEEMQTGTMATNGTVLKFCPAWVDQTSDDELIGTIAHEVMHCALGHPYRMSGRDHDRWNMACDLAINPILRADGFTLPAGALDDPAYHGMAAESIYARLPQNAKSDQPGSVEPAQQPGTGAKQPGNSEAGTEPGTEPGEPGSASESLSEADWKVAAESNAMVSRKAGVMPGSADRAIAQSRESVTDWKSILREYVAAIVPSDYSWSSPNRRYVSAGLYLPGMIKDGTARLGIAVDTSGSVTREMLAAISAEISAIVDEVKPEAVDVIYCDTRVNGSAQTFEPGDTVKLEYRGGGGTLFQPALDWFSVSENSPAAVIYLTDLENGGEILRQPEYPVLWVTDESSHRTAPFGQHIKMRL